MLNILSGHGLCKLESFFSLEGCLKLSESRGEQLVNFGLQNCRETASFSSMDQSFVSPNTLADGFSVSPLSPKGTSWEMKPSGSITCHLSHHWGLCLGVGKRGALPGSATFRLQSHLPWESAGLL